MGERDEITQVLGARPPQADVEARRMRASITEKLTGEARPERIDRFLILGRLGVGGLGVVYEAYDPNLDRKVALKLVRPGTHRKVPAAEITARMLREARAMARLSHPNVVAVHDAGIFGTEVYLVLELVRGQELGKWVQEKKRSWREILEVFRMAGRGLAAAHRAGFVHRDFKPSNVLVDESGRARVMDFGLATSAPSSASTPSLGDGSEATDDRDDQIVTSPGTIMGTPAYMAPEQRQGTGVDAKADQFAFCVTLHEALFGERPYRWRNAEELATLLETKPLPEPPPRDTRVPRWVRNAVTRGLALDPEERWPSMDALLQELNRDPSRRLRNVALGVLALSTVAAAAWAATVAEKQASQCDAADRLAGVWDRARQESIATAFHSSALPYAEATWGRVKDRTEAYVDTWSGAYTAACEELRQRPEGSAQSEHLRLACLETRLWELEGLTAVLATADAQVVENAVHAVTALVPVDSCAAERVARGLETPPPEQRETIAKLRQHVARAKGLETAGKYEEALAELAAVEARLEPLDHAPLRAELLYRRGVVQSHAGSYQKARADLEEAAITAEAAGLDELTARARMELAEVLAVRLVKPAEAETWARHADASIQRLGNPESLRARWLSVMGGVRLEQQRYDEALDLRRRAVEMLRARLGDDHPDLGQAYNSLGNVLYERGEYPAARAAYEEALANRIANLGPTHPRVAVLHNNLANAFNREDAHDRARQHLEKSLEVALASLPPDHPDVALSRHNYGLTLTYLGDYEGASRELRKSLTASEAAFDADHPRVTSLHNTLGWVLYEVGKPEEARTETELALASFVERLGETHPDTAWARFQLGRWHDEYGDPGEAVKLHAQAYRTRSELYGPDSGMALSSEVSLLSARARVGPPAAVRERLEQIRELSVNPPSVEHPDLADVDAALARTYILEGKPADALLILDRALAAVEAEDFHTRGMLVFLQAQAELSRSRDRARALSKQALEIFGSQPGGDRYLDKIRRWRSRHGLGPA